MAARRGIGLLGLGTAGTAGLLGGLLVVILTAAADPAALLYVAPPVLAGGGLALARVRGEPLALAALRRARWHHAASRGWTRYRADVVAEYSPAFPLPGVLAPLTLLDAEDGYGGRYGIVLDRRTGMMTATLQVIPASPVAGRPRRRRRVGGELGRVAVLARLPARAAVGDGHRRYRPRAWHGPGRRGGRRAGPGRAAARAADHGPARRRCPGGSSRRRHLGEHHLRPCRFSVGAARGDRRRRRDRAEALHGLESALGTCGVTVLGRASAADIAGMVRIAFDPAVRGQVSRLLAQSARRSLNWAEARPGRGREEPGLLPARQRHRP